MCHTNVLKFWFKILSPKDWWRKDESLDARIRNEFREIHQRVACGQTGAWRTSDEGRLAEIIVLDQFSRNMFRGRAEAFAYDSLALELCKSAVAAGTAERLDQSKANFLLMPFMHSESLSEHQAGLTLFKQFGSESSVAFEVKHAAIIERFGRYPHRNRILERASTPEEQTFLTSPGSSF